MSTVNRNSYKIQRYTQNTQEASLASLMKYLTALNMHLDNLEMDGAEDPNLKKCLREAKDNIKEILRNVQRIKEVNNRLDKESCALIAIAENDDFIRINTEPVKTGLAGAVLSVDGFYNAVAQWVDCYTMGIKEKIIQGSLVEFKTRVTAKRDALNRQKEQLTMRGSDDSADLQKIAQLTAQIDRLNRCLAAAGTYEKRLYMICSDLAKVKDAAYSITVLIRKINQLASNKVQAIEQAVNN